MAAKVFLGIDLGTSVLKVCAFDGRTGALLASGSQRLRVHVIEDGGREQKPVAIDRAFARIVRQLRTELGDAWRNVQGIGLAAQGGSCIIADRRTGKPLTPMVLWNDSRAHKHLASLAALTSPDFWREYTLRDIPPTGLGRLLWLQQKKPSLFAKSNIHIGAGEYLFFKLTGMWRQDPGNAIQVGSYNAVTMQLDDNMLDLVDVPVGFFAPLRQGHPTAPLSKQGARALGLPSGIPVAGPYIDQEAAYLSAADRKRRPLQCSLGTAWVGNFVMPADAIPRSAYQLVLPDPVGDGRLVVQPLLAGNTAWDWALTTFLNPDHGKALAKADAVFKANLLPPDGLVSVPFVTQRNPLDPSAYGGGTFVGVSSETTPADMLRAVAAAMTCELARVFEEARKTAVFDSVVLAGGAGKGAFFRTLAAGLFAPIPVLWQDDEDLSAARGALHALSTKAARAKAKRVAKPKKSEMTRIQRHAALYARVLHRINSAEANAAAIT